MMPRSKQIAGLIGWLALAFIAAAIGAIASTRAPEFYQALIRPSWAPPAALFGPVWSVLYLMMGVASWLVWREGSVNTRPSRRGSGRVLLFFVASRRLDPTGAA